MLNVAVCALLVLHASGAVDVRRSLRIENAELAADLKAAELLADEAILAATDDYTAELQADVVDALEEYADKLSDAQVRTVPILLGRV